MSERDKLGYSEAEAIANAIGKLKEYSVDPHASGHRQFWEGVRATSTLLRQSRNVARATLADFHDELSSLCVTAKQAAEERDRRSKDNTPRFERALREAEAMLHQDFVGQIMSEPNFGAFFGNLVAIGRQLQADRLLRKGDRDRLRQKLDAAFASGKQLQHRKLEKRELQSASRLERILSLVGDAELSIRWEGKREESLRGADAKLREAFLWIKGDTSVLHLFGETFHNEFTREHRQEAFERWRTVSDHLHTAWKHLRASNNRDFLEMAQEALRFANNQEPREARSHVKETQAKMKGRSLEKFDYEIIHSILNRAYKESRQVDLSRFLAQRGKKEDLISRLKEHLSDLEDKARGARSESFSETVSGWIKDKKRILQELQEQLQTIEDKIRDMER